MREYIIDRISGETPPCKEAVLHITERKRTYYTVKAENLDDLFFKIDGRNRLPYSY
jgi:hypothetical protein